MERLIRQERAEAKKFGVVVFILDGNNMVYTLQEEEERCDTQKQEGQFGVVCESAQSEELPYANFWRGLREEVGLPEETYTKILDFSNYRVFEAGFVEKVWATVVVLRCNDKNLFMQQVGAAQELDKVRPVGFLSRGDFSDLNLRPGVRNILEKFGDQIFQQ